MKFISSVFLSILFSFTLFGASLPEVTVFKSPYCGCCGQWVKHMQKNGFKVHVILKKDMDSIKRKFDIPMRLSSCHTAIIGKYIIEGHVPADVIKKFLAQSPDYIRGLTVPGMIIGSPGMEQGGVKIPYNVLTFDEYGKTTIYAKE